MHNINNTHNKDKVFKESMQLFKGGSLDFLDSKLTTIEEILSTEITETTTKKAYADFVFKLSGGSDPSAAQGLHIEWEDEVSLPDIMRFASYNIDLARMHNINFATIVVTNKKPKASEYVGPSLAFRPKIVYLKERDADAVLSKINNKLEKGEPVNELELVYLPLYGSESGKTMYDLLDAAIKLSPKVSHEKEKRNKLQSLLTLLMGKFAYQDEFRKVLEANMNILEDNVAIKVLEEIGMDRGLAKGLSEGLARGLAQGEAEGLARGKAEGLARGKAEGLARGKAQGEAEGLAKAKTETALEMLKDGLNIKKVSQYTQMPISWVEDLLKEINP